MNIKNYFDEVKNKSVRWKLPEHIARLLFFTVLLSIESFFKRCKDLLYHGKNILKNRTMADIMAKYSRYKQSVQNLIEKGDLALHSRISLSEIKDHFFKDDEKTLIFGFKETTQNIMTRSIKAINSFKGYTKSIGERYFASSPIKNSKGVYSSVFFKLFTGKPETEEYSALRNGSVEGRKKYLNELTTGYRSFRTGAFKKFYSREFQKKVTATTAGMNTAKKNMNRLIYSIEKLEKKQIKCVRASAG